MSLIDATAARAFAHDWIGAWNRHDLDAVLAHYADDFQFTSPLIVELAGEASGTLRGKAKVRAYWGKGLERMPDLRFELLDVLAGVDQVVVYYRGHRGMVTEVFQFDDTRRVISAAASYAVSEADVGRSSDTRGLPALDPYSVVARTGSIYPTGELRQRMDGRTKRALGDPLGLQNFGINLVTLEPGALSSLRHWHSRQDEFVYVLEGRLTLVTDSGEQSLGPGLCAGFPAGTPEGHHLVNRSSQPARYLEVGDRLPGDRGYYPEEDLEAVAVRGAYSFFHKDGSAY